MALSQGLHCLPCSHGDLSPGSPCRACPTLTSQVRCASACGHAPPRTQVSHALCMSWLLTPSSEHLFPPVWPPGPSGSPHWCLLFGDITPAPRPTQTHSAGPLCTYPSLGDATRPPAPSPGPSYHSPQGCQAVFQLVLPPGHCLGAAGLSWPPVCTILPNHPRPPVPLPVPQTPREHRSHPITAMSPTPYPARSPVSETRVPRSWLQWVLTPSVL